jgi:PAS domain S-box-containing protein
MRFAVDWQSDAPPDPPPAWAHGSLFREVVVQLTFFAVYLLLDRASTVFRMWAGTPAWYLPSGVALAVLIWGGLRYAPVFLASSVAATVFDYHLPILSWAGLPGTIGTSLFYVFGAGWLRHRWRLDPKLRRLRDVGGLVLFLLFFEIPAALVGVLALLGDGRVSKTDFFKAALDWWVGDSISVASLTPFLLLYVAPRVANFLNGTRAPKPVRRAILGQATGAEGLELAAELASIIAALWLALVFRPAATYQPLYLLLLPVIWMAVRRGLARASLGVLVINLGVIAAAHLTRPDPEGLSRRQLVMLALALTGLCLGAVVGERRRAEGALRLSEEKFARAFRARPVGLSISTLSDGRLVEVNDTFLRLFECEADRVIGKTSLELNLWENPEDRSRMMDALREHGRATNVERRHRSSSGRIFTVLSSADSIELGGVPCLLATFLDITQDKAAQQALRESEQRYRDFITHSTEGVWRLELEPPLPIGVPEEEALRRLLDNGYFAECNLAFARNLGLSSPEEVVGRRLRDVIPFTDSDQEGMESLRSVARDGFRSRTVEFRARDKAGKLRNWFRTEIPIVENGLLLRVWGITRDITARKQAEEALRENEARLRSLSDNLPGGMVYELDLGDGETRQFTHVSAGVERMHELTAEAVLQDAQLIYDQTVEADRPLVAAGEAQMLATMKPFFAEVRRRLPSGVVRWSLLSSAPRRAPDGTIICDGIELDITERKRAEEALRESEERFRTTFENAGIGIAVVDLQGRPIQCNAALQRMLGYTEEELLRMSFTEFTHPDDRDLNVEFYRELVAEKRDSYRMEKRYIRKDGQIVWGFLTVSLVKDAQGRPQYGVGMAEDITERKRATEALRASETQFRTFIDMAPVAISVSRSGKTLHVNRKFLEMYGFHRADEVFGHSVGEHWSAEWRPVVEERARQRALGLPAPTRYEGVGQRKDGSQFLVEVVVASVILPDGDANIAFLADVTERKRAEQALRESEERFRTTFENAGIGIALVDMSDGRPIQCNPALQRMLGYSENELRRMSFTEFSHPDDRYLDMGLYRELTGGKRDKYEIEKRYIRKDGQVVWGLLTASLVKDVEGRPQYAVGMVEDITERKRAEDDLRKLNAELEQRVMERTEQLKLTNREVEIRNSELSASNQELEAFSYSVAHDLRAPLRQIQGFSHLLLEGHSAELAPEAHKYVRNIIEGAQHMGRLIDDLLDLSRLGRRALSLEVNDLAALVEDARRDLARETDGRDVSWQIGDLPLVECDAVLIRQVFVNLLSNALKYTQRRQPAVIEVGQVNREGVPVVFVKDNGVGFNMKYAGKLFGVFQRLHRREDFEGTGIGLATVKRIVDKHGGRVWAEAELDKGATFCFTLAAQPEGASLEENLLTAEQKVGLG